MFSLIVCTDAEFGIGMMDGTIPFHNPADLLNFKKLTTNQIVIMGRKTWNSLPRKPLKNRLNIVITHEIDFHIKNGMVFQNIQTCINELKRPCYDKQEKFIIGGETMYDYSLCHNLIDTIYHTMVHNDFQCEIKIKPFIYSTMDHIHTNESQYTNKWIQSSHTDGFQWTYTIYKIKKHTNGNIFLKNINRVEPTD